MSRTREWTLPERVEGWSIVSTLILVVTCGGALWAMEHFRDLGGHRAEEDLGRARDPLTQTAEAQSALAGYQISRNSLQFDEFCLIVQELTRSLSDPRLALRLSSETELAKARRNVLAVVDRWNALRALPSPATPDPETIGRVMRELEPRMLEVWADLRRVNNQEATRRSLDESQSIDRIRALSNAVIVGLVLSLGIIVHVLRLVRLEAVRRKKAESALAAGEARYRAVTENASDAIFTVDGQGQITYANRSVHAVFGRDPGQLQGRPMSALLVEPLPVGPLGSASESHENGSLRPERTVFEMNGIRADRSEFPLELSMARWRSGGEPNFTVIMRDISERKRAEWQLRSSHEELEHRVKDRTAELERVNAWLTQEVAERRRAEEEALLARQAAELASQAKSEFLANMSHEIRTPMNGILGMCELALDTELSSRQREYLSLVKSSAEALLTVINDILDYSKIEAGRLDVENLPFDLNALFEETLQVLALRAHGKGLELAFRLDRQLPRFALGDVNRLRQVLVNLIGNALKFTERGEVLVEATAITLAGAPGVEVRVSDSGIGIPADRLAAIFEPFEQADGSMTRRFGGTGLGLAISNRLVTLMGGSLKVESTVGRGSTFTFTIRMEPSAEPAGPVTQRHPFDGLPALIVDDHATNRRILREILQNWGFKSTEVEGAEPALAALRQARELDDPYRVALLDVMMPGQSGLELARSIRAEGFGEELILLLLSSAGGIEDDSRLEPLAISACVTKPIRQSQLFDLLAHALDRTSTREPLPTRSESSETLACESLPCLEVLLAEDHPVNQKVAVRMLEGLGQHVTVVANGQEALQAIERRPFDVVLMDVQMPILDGLEATRSIRARETPGGFRLPIVALTAHAMKGDRERCLEAGFDDYLPKPIRRDMLRTLLERMSPRSTPSDTAAPLSLDRVLDACGNDRALAHEVLVSLRESAPKSLARIELAAQSDDPKGLAMESHGLRGACVTLGALDLAEACRAVEEPARQGRLEEARRSVGAIREAWDRLSPDLLESEGILT
jgi:PAS domain S-box-containing protein